MRADEAHQLIKYMAATWQTRMDDPQAVVVWVETLAPFSARAVRDAITELKSELDWMPTHKQITDRTASVVRRTANDRGLPAGDEQVPEVCALCEGTGWQEMPPHMQRGVMVSGAVSRCRCQERKDRVRDEQGCKAGCSCLSCHYGKDRAAHIKRGLDGITLAGEAADAKENIGSIRQTIRRFKTGDTE